jgi:hypothetical protein
MRELSIRELFRRPQPYFIIILLLSPKPKPPP